MRMLNARRPDLDDTQVCGIAVLQGVVNMWGGIYRTARMTWLINGIVAGLWRFEGEWV